MFAYVSLATPRLEPLEAKELTDGRARSPDRPWLHIDELFWDATAGRQVWAEVTFPKPTDVRTLTVYEHLAHPESWPTEGLVQVWSLGSGSSGNAYLLRDRDTYLLVDCGLALRTLEGRLATIGVPPDALTAVPQASGAQARYATPLSVSNARPRDDSLLSGGGKHG